MRKFYHLFLLLFLQINSVCSLCKMPTAWIGSWYQRGMNSLIEITNDYIQTKGFCIDGQLADEYYLFSDQSTRCNRCLKFIQRHINFLQYRESECQDPDELLNVTTCSNLIAPDAVLYTLHRNNSQAQLCPIEGRYSIIKDNSFCDQSLSQCANKQEFHLHISPACSSSQSTLNLHCVCVGTWSENQYTYFVTRILTKSNNHYACFKYLTQQHSSNLLVLNMATDDSCRDLDSQHMSIKLKLSFRHRHFNESSCRFPSKYQSMIWFSLNRSIEMTINDQNIEIKTLNKRFSCQKFVDSDRVKNSVYQVETYTNCQRRIECLQLIERTSNILEIYTYSYNREHQCQFPRHSYHFSQTFHTQSFATHCPNHLGQLKFQSNIDYYLKRNFFMSIGCSKRHQLTVSTGNSPSSTIETNNCLGHWQSDDQLLTYLLIQSTSTNQSHCLSFQMTDPIIIRNNSNRCLFNQNEDEQKISVYSAQIIQICSNGKKTSLNTFSFLVLVCLFFFKQINSSQYD